MKNICFSLVALTLILVGCKTDNKNPEVEESQNVLVKMKVKGGIDSPIGVGYRPFRFLDSIPDNFKGIIQRDSSFLGYLPTINYEEREKLFNKGLITKDVYENTNTNVYVLTGYKDGKHFYILDKNLNNDFSDEEVIEFSNALKQESVENPNLRDSIPTFKITVNKLENDSLYKDEIFLGVYPNANYYQYKNKATSDREKLKRDLLIISKTTTYLEGLFFSKGIEYKVAVNAERINSPKFIFREKNSPYFTYQQTERQEYTINDTVKLAETYYEIKNFSNNKGSFNLEKLEIDGDNYIGFRKGETVKNQQLENLNGEIVNMTNLFDGKEFLLLDFWGTWCAPCKKLTPELVILNEKHNEKVSFASLAFEKDPKPVKDYVIKTNMNWHNLIIKGTPKTMGGKPKIISDLRVDTFPTFIILDSNMKIVFRGHGGHFDEMKVFLNTLSSQ